jgi:phage shock protein C
MNMEKRLHRSSREKMLAGVAGGLAEYTGLDPALIRLLFVVLALLGGHGLLIYLLLAVILPQE